MQIVIHSLVNEIHSASLLLGTLLNAAAFSCES